MTKHTHIVKKLNDNIGLALEEDISESLAHGDLSDMPDTGGTNSDHDARYYTETEVDSLLDDTYTPTTLTEVDIDFSSSSSEDVTINIGKEVREVLRGRIWMDTDPGADFDEWVTITFYNKSAKTGEDALYRTTAKVVYTELESATSGSDANITPDDHTLFSPHDLILFQDDDELARLATIADTMVAEDTVGSHSINTGISRVIEFSGFSLYNMESATNVYMRISFDSAQTVSLKAELVVRN